MPGPSHGGKGKHWIRNRIRGFNNAARFQPWLVIIDLNDEAACPPLMLANWVPAPASHLCFRVAVREIEAWLLADTHALATFLSVRRGAFPANPEAENDPKVRMVTLAQQSRRRAIREDMVPRPGSRRSTGPAYDSRLVEFVQSTWRPEIAAQTSDSLNRAIECLRMISGVPPPSS